MVEETVKVKGRDEGLGGVIWVRRAELVRPLEENP